jgi:hypothetical protein
MTTPAEFLASIHGDESPAAMVARRARESEQRDERQAVWQEAEDQAAADDRREARLLRYAQTGIGARSAAEIFAGASSAADEDGEYADCAARMEKIERRRESRARAQQFEAEQVAAVSRADTGNPAGIERANQLAAALRVDRMLAAAPSSVSRSVNLPKDHAAGCEICLAARAREREAGRNVAWEDERSLRIAHGGSEGWAVR